MLRHLAFLVALTVAWGLPLTAQGAPEPGPLGYSQLAYDGQAKILVLYGGQPDSKRSVNTTWLYDPGTAKWRKSSSPQAPTMGEGPMVYDPKHGRVILFVTLDYFGGSRELNETWEYDGQADVWSKIETATAPTKGLLGARMAYDSNSDKMVLFGGYSVWTNKYKNETWSFDYAAKSWRQMSPASPPRGRNFHMMAFDPGAHRVLMLGGDGPAGMSAYDFPSDTWTVLAVPEMPPRLEYASVNIVAKTGKAYLFGGALVPSEKASGDTWELDCRTLTWRRLDLGQSPGPRAWYASDYDEDTGRIYFYGGGKDRESFTEEFWAFDPASKEWEKLKPK